jgi:cytochrome c
MGKALRAWGSAFFIALLVVAWSQVIGEGLRWMAGPAPWLREGGHETEVAMAEGETPASGEKQAKEASAPEPEKAAATVPLSEGDAKAGEKVAKKCHACHTFGKGEPNRVGPNLWGVVGRDIASAPDFKYSSSLSEKGGSWTPEKISTFISNPKGFASNSKMTFQLKSAQDRADVIAYLETLKD